MTTIHKLDTNLNDIFQCENEEAGQEMVEAMANITRLMIDEMFELSEEYGESVNFKGKCGMIFETLKQYMDFA